MKGTASVELHQEVASFLIRPFLIETGPDETHEPPHRHDFQEILWVRGGEGRQAIDGELLSIAPHTFYLIARGQVHQLITGIQIDGLVIRFTDDFLPHFPALEMGHYQTMLFNNVTINHTLPLRAADVDDFETVLTQLVRAQQRQGEPGQREIIRHLLTVLLIKLQQVQSRRWQEVQTAVSDDAHLFHRFTLLLEQQYAQSHAVQHYAAVLGITSRHLSDVARRLVGQTAKGVIDGRIALEARRYLTFTNLSVKEIAFALGYKDPSYFSKSFKKQTGVSPQSYKGVLEKST